MAADAVYIIQQWVILQTEIQTNKPTHPQKEPMFIFRAIHALYHKITGTTHVTTGLTMERATKKVEAEKPYRQYGCM